MTTHARSFAPPSAELEGKRLLIGLSREELAAEVAAMGEPAFRAKQLWHWIYDRGAESFEGMTSLSKGFREKLAESYVIGRPSVKTHQKSVDGTQKWLLRFPDGQEVESVHIPESDRGTLCVSSQVGCTLTCKFCHTGTQRLVRNLSASEIVGQVMLAKDSFDEWPASREGRAITNLVMMGMGEPLYNFENVAKALRIVMDGEGLGISKRKITLSTAGVVPMMKRCGEELGVNLAVSLHAVNDEIRDQIVPINKKYPLAELLQACRDYPGVHNARRITFEYVMLKGINDSDADARELVRILDGIPAKVNLIPFNPWPGAPYECSEPERVETFADILASHHMSAPVRQPRGQDIFAACGQLKSESQRLKKSEREAQAAANA
ncbi:MAG: 23S rRNA (adenine(2503)-C(2))-methyltransferase RlmN [Limibacillus sp.]|jgi:23S rRNA (adenine2503-C2)-methyltransferase